MRTVRRGLDSGLVLFVLILAAACGGEEPAEPEAGGGEPTKEALITVLRTLQASLDAKDYPAAVTSMAAFPGMTDEQMQEALGGFIEKREISAGGIDILQAKGRYGPLLEVFPERGEHFAKKAAVDAEACFAMSHEDAEVAAH